MHGIVKPSLALSLMLLATLVASISTSSNKEEKILMVAEGRCRGRLIRVSRSECTGLFMDPTFRFMNSWLSWANDELLYRWCFYVWCRSFFNAWLSQPNFQGALPETVLQKERRPIFHFSRGSSPQLPGGVYSSSYTAFWIHSWLLKVMFEGNRYIKKRTNKVFSLFPGSHYLKF